MLEAIAAAPDDDAPRLVYADWLTEQQDPRGEFITLQIRRAHRVATAAERKRETALFADHRKAFLAPFEKCVALSGLKFERGFLVAARVTTTLPASTLTRLLRSLEFEGGGFAPGARFDHLERADCSRVRTGYRLTGKAPRLREWTISAQTPEELEQWLGKTSLRVLHLKRIGAAVGAALPALYAHRALAQLEELDVQAPDLPVLSLKQAPATLRRFELQARSLNVALERGTKGWTGAVSAYPSTRRDELQTILRSEAFTHLTRLVMRCNEFSKRELLALAASIVKCPVTHELTSW
ncbi:MAG: TIGR02996 domain-containing protein [Myxococcaceae bacterium]|nr:TIGR02996 domain-containing protein [Myxococcaceae bacterium]